MGDFALIVAGFFVSGLAGAVFGGLLVWVRVGRALKKAEVEPADVFDGVEEETAEVPVLAPVLARWFDEDFVEFEPEPEPEPERAVALRPMSAMERLEGPTRRIIRDADGFHVEPWWYGGRHRELETRLRTAPYVVAPAEHLPTTEYPLLEAS